MAKTLGYSESRLDLRSEQSGPSWTFLDILVGRGVAHVLGRRAGREQYWSSQAREVWRRLCKLAVDTIPLKDSNRGRMRTLNWAQVKEQAC